MTVAQATPGHAGIPKLPAREPEIAGHPCMRVQAFTAARLIERLLPQSLRILDDALRLTPVDRLDGVLASGLITAPPDDLHFGLGTRTRASLLLGLPVPR